MEVITDFKDYQERITSSLVNVTRSAGQISNQDLGFHRSSSEKLSKALDAQNTHLLRLTNKLLKAATKDTNIKLPTLRDRDGVDDNWRTVVDVVDDLLEKADASLDEFTGVLRRMSPAVQESPNVNGQTSSVQARPSRSTPTWNRESMPKPQLLFNKKPDNYDAQPFRPLLIAKPHALVSLNQSIGNATDGFKHPYAYEIQHCPPPSFVYQKSPPIPFTPPDASQAIFVDTEEGVREMLDELKQAKEIAIDLEHNERRSYIGMVSLMQISTRNKDWIVDTLKPWRENLQVLNEVFTDPRILKVFHGSSMDMIWLQRDLGLYVVGLFDTYHACVALQFPGRGLKYLLQRFANFEAQKQYQTADWRIRPLPQELIDYARSDTHYLLYIFDHLRIMLLENSSPTTNLVDQVLEGSKTEALQVYERPLYDSTTGMGHLGWFGLLQQRPTRFDNEQFAVFRAVHEWRDQKAREWDEGLQYVMPNAAIWSIAETLPLHMGALHNAVRPMAKPVADNAKELIEVIRKAKFEGRDGPAMADVIQQNGLKYGFQNRRWRKEKEELKTQHTGLGATLQQLNQNGELSTSNGTPVEATTPVEAAVTAQADYTSETPMIIRNNQSTLWGRITNTVAGISAEANAAMSALQSVLPLPRLSANSFTEAQAISPIAVLESTSPITPITNGNKTVTPQPKDDIFTLKELSRKRKADEQELIVDSLTVTPVEPDNMQEDFSPLPKFPDETHDAARQKKKQRKAEKKAAKEARKTAAAAAQSSAVPFDYDGAESLLHPPAAVLPDVSGKGTKTGKAMNPFTKGLNTTTGARRSKMGKELPGKSHTFTS